MIQRSQPLPIMHTRLLALACLITVTTTFAADAPKLPSIPEQPIAQKKELLFSDDFERAELAKAPDRHGRQGVDGWA